jgi:hypothetical protein
LAASDGARPCREERGRADLPRRGVRDAERRGTFAGTKASTRTSPQGLDPGGTLRPEREGAQAHTRTDEDDLCSRGERLEGFGVTWVGSTEAP